MINYSKSKEHQVYVHDLYIEIGRYTILIMWKPVKRKSRKYLYTKVTKTK